METDIIKTMDKDVRTRKRAHRQIEILSVTCHRTDLGGCQNPGWRVPARRDQAPGRFVAQKPPINQDLGCSLAP